MSTGAPGEGGGPQPGYTASGTASYPASSYPVAPPRRLRRVMADKKIAGVCSGFAEYFDMDVTLVRLIWVGLVLLPPAPGLFIYFVAWIILPKG